MTADSLKVLVGVAIGVMLMGCSNAGLSREGSKFTEPCVGDPRPELHWGRCQMVDADLSGADLSGSLFSSVDFSGADLSGANLKDASLVDVKAEGAKLFDADLSGATISGGNIQKALFCNTTMPSGSVANGDC